jgi:hypothetical protein
MADSSFHREASETGGPSLSVAETIGRLHMRDDSADFEELLILLREGMGRQWFVARLSEEGR